jgi:hypothetical protein
MIEPGDPKTEAERRRRRVLLGAAAFVVIVAGFVGLALFQPWKLWVDDTVNEAAPAGAVAVTAAAPTVGDPVTTTATSPPTTVPPPATTSASAVAADPATMPPTTVAPPTTRSPPPPEPVGGDFAGIDHGTAGRVVVLQDAAGTQFVRLENLDTSNGPDLFVYLSTNPPDGPEGQFDDDYVNLGRLEGNVGSSNYVVPAGTDLARYASVVIWCDRFNSAFGAAPLS